MLKVEITVTHDDDTGRRMSAGRMTRYPSLSRYTHISNETITESSYTGVVAAAIAAAAGDALAATHQMDRK